MDAPDQTSKQRTRLDLKTVLETSRVLIEAKDVDFVLENLLRIAMGKLLVSRAVILLKEQNHSHYRTAFVKGNTGLKTGDKLSLKLPEKIFTKTKPHILIPEVADKIPVLAEHFPQGALFNLRTSSQHLGFLVVSQKATKTEFSEQELEFLESLCIISSSAVANSQMFDQLSQANRSLDQRIHELNTLFDLSKEFNLLTDREKISRIFKFALMGQLFVRSFFLIYRSEDSIELLASSNFSDPDSKDNLKQIFELTEDITLVDEDLSENYPVLLESDICSLVSISIHQRKIAVIGVGNRANRKPFTESDYNFLKSLANLAINSIQRTYLLEERIEKERMEEELSIAKSIQQKLLPNPVPEIQGLDLSAITVSSYHVGGDYFDVAQTPDGNHILAIADVTGKGFPAALLMANLQSMLHILLPFDISLPVATERINHLIFQNTPSDKFITFFWGKYFHEDQRFTYVNAGHNPPLMLRSGSQNFSELTEGGLLLGAIDTVMPYELGEVKLTSGDIVVCYTDGINEAQSGNNDEEFGIERLKKSILEHRGQSSREIREAIISDVKAFTGSYQFDDLTLLIFKVN